jgi:hypothetical protein
MTTPTQAKRSFRGPRTYAWPPLPPYEFEVLSVTSAISAGVAKPYLTGWAAKLVAETAVADQDIVVRLLERGDERGAIDHLKGAPYRQRQAAADRGTLVHAAIESYLGGKKVTEEELREKLKEEGIPTKLWKTTIAMVGGLVDFMFDEEPEVIWTESTVYNRTHGYAGTADLIARMRVGGTVVPVILDVKTSKRIYDEVALQLAAYARAEFVGLDDGTEAPLIPEDAPNVPAKVFGIDLTPKIEYGVVVRPKPSGGYEKAVFTLSDEVYDTFLGCLAVARGLQTLDTARRPS